jgi:hypothetical protein
MDYPVKGKIYPAIPCAGYLLLLKNEINSEDQENKTDDVVCSDGFIPENKQCEN